MYLFNYLFIRLSTYLLSVCLLLVGYLFIINLFIIRFPSVQRSSKIHECSSKITIPVRCMCIPVRLNVPVQYILIPVQ
jgi:hypothetical protein